ncbi:hypothetical protein BS47DRAFT_532731 [Hydnum rufescens UP504]|uniref:Uncharacterized protein n=1 Tax=Hydnum rufescens UP504 TaxID=1448309 RepID=A0A9P6B4N4_9AGAM|nr:hypothetical protein BS47DRAFT_532731 [Hydnum rufescens UP504]
MVIIVLEIASRCTKRPFQWYDLIFPRYCSDAIRPLEINGAMSENGNRNYTFQPHIESRSRRYSRGPLRMDPLVPVLRRGSRIWLMALIFILFLVLAAPHTDTNIKHESHLQQ